MAHISYISKSTGFDGRIILAPKPEFMTPNHRRNVLHIEHIVETYTVHQMEQNRNVPVPLNTGTKVFNMVNLHKGL